MYIFIKDKVDTDTNIPNVLVLDIEHMLYLPNSRNTPNTMALEGF